MEARGGFQTKITPELIAVLTEVDTAYLATATAAGQPYVQHRGGPKGFICALDETTLGFADYAGNRQYITVGNLAENDQAFLFLMGLCAPATRQNLGKRADYRGRSRTNFEAYAKRLSSAC
jgi:predicted pyridoxine 5'-phosphate oxidase superfamily flavin-nucleotide-binding protein